MSTTSSAQVPLGSGFGHRSEPGEVLDDIDLAGAVAVVTGGYSGIGLETTRALAARGAQVHVPVRSPEKAADALAGVEGDVHSLPMDLGDLASVRRAAQELSDALAHLDLLINNAGIMASPEARVGPGWEQQIGVNHLGHFALTTALLPLLRRAEAPRVVALSSVAHQRAGIDLDDPHFRTRPYDKWEAYGQAKTANALFARGVSARLAEDGGRAFSVHPGGIFTPLQRHLPKEEQVMLGWIDEDGNPTELAANFFKTPTQGCTTTLWAATSPLLADRHGVYCEDCDIAAPLTDDSPRGTGVAAHATDDEMAGRLWTWSEAELADA